VIAATIRAVLPAVASGIGERRTRLDEGGARDRKRYDDLGLGRRVGQEVAMTSVSKRLTPLVWAGLGLAAGIAACTSAQTPEPGSAARESRQCFLPSQVNGFTPIDRDTVDVRVGANQIYRLELTAYCGDIDWALRVGIRSTASGNWVCQGLDAELIAPGPLGPEICHVDSVRRLSDEEAEAARRERRD
jgi:hypothetical protein